MRRRQARQEQRTSGAAAPATGAAPATDSAPSDTTYQMRERLFTIRDRFVIKNGVGRGEFAVNGKLMRVRSTLMFEDMNGNTLFQIQEKMARVRDTMDVEDANGKTVAKVHNALVTPLRDRWTINIPGGADLVTKGNILHHEYTIARGGQPVATISKRWFRVRDTYGVKVEAGENPALALAITVVIDMMAHS